MSQVTTIVTPDTILQWYRLVVRMAEENPAWGYTRILKAQGLPPVPERPTSWETFLRAHWSAPVRERLGEAGIRIVKTPFQTPNANACAERFVRSIKHECLNRVIPFGERHVRRAIAEFVEHYHRERNHQGLSNELIDTVSPGRNGAGIRSRQRLGGLLNYYFRAA